MTTIRKKKYLKQPNFTYHRTRKITKSSINRGKEIEIRAEINKRDQNNNRKKDQQN